MSESWLIDEAQYAGAEHLDEAFVDGYDRKQGYPEFASDVAALRRLGLDDSSTVVDIGAGTGGFTLVAAREFRRVVAVDVSPAMLDALRARVTAEDITNVETRHAGFLTYRHEGGAADAVYSRNALHQLPDLFKVVALSRLAEALRPGGVLLLRDLVFDAEPGTLPAVIEAWMAGAATDPDVGYTRRDFVDHLRTEYSTVTWLLEPMLERSGFEIVHREHLRSVYACYRCIKR